MAELCNSDNVSRLLDVYKFFTEDSQKIVKNSAIEVIGLFTNVLPRNYIPAKFILDFYIKVLDNLYLNKDVVTLADNEIFYQCAYNFPAVLYYFGKDSWQELSKYYIKMTNDKYFKVRKSLASSINEISNIIGKEETEKTLIPIFDRFYREDGEIQRAIYKSMPKFLLNINYEKRIAYLERIKKLMNGREKWRVKKECVEILGNLGGVYEEDITFELIFPICVKLCVDEVAEVRIHSAKSIKSLIIQFLNNEKYRSKVLNIINAFGSSIKYIYRNLYLHISEELVDNKDLFIQYFIGNLEKLSRDKVINIQIHMAKLISRMYESGIYNDNEIFRKMYLRVSLNKNKLVQENLVKISDKRFTFINEAEEKEIGEEENSNASFNNRMEALRDANVMIGPGLLNSKNKFVLAKEKEKQKEEKPGSELKSNNLLISNTITENDSSNIISKANGEEKVKEEKNIVKNDSTLDDKDLIQKETKKEELSGESGECTDANNSNYKLSNENNEETNINSSNNANLLEYSEDANSEHNEKVVNKEENQSEHSQKQEEISNLNEIQN